MVEMNQQHPERMASLFARILMRNVTLGALSELGEEDELSLSQLQCLRFLSQHPKSRLCQISDGLLISNPAATKLVDRLVKKGLVQSILCPCDRRSMDVDLTPKGQAIIEEFRERRSKRLEAILDKMEIEDCAALLRGIEKFIFAALQDGESLRTACLNCGDEHDPECPANQAREQLDCKQYEPENGSIPEGVD